MTAQLPEMPVTALNQLYEQDYYRWLQEIAKRLRSGKLAELDVANLAEEIEDMGRSEKRAVESNLEVILMHLLKYKFQPELRSNSWRSTLLEHRNRLRKAFKESPSLKNYLMQTFDESYQHARRMAAAETDLLLDTLPSNSPFNPEQTLDFDFLPE